MSYTVIETRTKPTGATWFGVVEPHSAQSADEFAKSSTGFISVNKVKSNNKVVRTYVFDTMENFNAYLSARSSNPDEAARKEYNTANSISTSILGQ